MGRLFHAIIMLGGVSLFLWRGMRKWDGRFSVIIAAYLVFAGIACAMIQYLSTSQDLPQMLFADRTISRPFDMIPLGIYVLTALLVYPHFHRRVGSTFSLALLLGAIPDVATQLHMAFGSKVLFDNHFIIACGLKVVAYVIPFTGLVWDYMRAHRAVHDNVDRLRAEMAERVRAEALVADSERQLQRFLDHASDLIQIVASTGAFHFVNRSWREALQYTDQDLADLRWEQVVAPEHREMAQAHFAKVMRGENADTIVLALLAKDGHRVTVEGSANCIYEHDRAVAMHCSLRDITERQRAIADLRETHRRRPRLQLEFDKAGLP